MPDARLHRHDDNLWRVEGDLDLDAVPNLLEESVQLWQSGGTCVVDFAHVRRIDSSSVALLLEWQRQARQREVTVRYRNVPHQLLAIAQVCGVKGLLPLESPTGAG